MASRQKAFPDDPLRHGIVDEEIVSGAGEGDEIMEEVEGQEDGYSVYISNSFQNPVVYIRHLLLLLIHDTKIILTANYKLASSTPTSTLTWISWFCSLPGHEYFCEVTEEFIEDDFNLTGLNALVPFWKEAMEMILDVEPGVDAFPILNKQCHTYSLTEDEDTSKIPDVSIVESSAEMLYGLVHQRYILTRAGLQAMVR
jgi:casein kinase II subunit beta